MVLLNSIAFHAWRMPISAMGNVCVKEGSTLMIVVAHVLRFVMEAVLVLLTVSVTRVRVCIRIWMRMGAVDDTHSLLGRNAKLADLQIT